MTMILLLFQLKTWVFSSKSTAKTEKGKPKKVLAQSNASKNDMAEIDYSKKVNGGKVVRRIRSNEQQIIRSFLFSLQETNRVNPTAPIADRPEQGDLKTMLVEYVDAR